MPPAAIIAGAAVVGGIAGAMPKKQESSAGLNLAEASDTENYGRDLTLNSVRELAGYVDKGPGAEDVAAATGSQRDLASLLDQYAKGGYKPSDADIASGNDLASKLFQAQRVGLNQSFEDQRAEFNQQAALMGRDPLDPVFRNKLAQQQTRDQQLLDAQQGAFGTQLAMDSPLQRLNFASQKAQVQSGLASQALANRQMLAGLGEGIMTNERNFRLATAERWGKQESGGGFGGFLSGALAGAGSGFGIAKGFGFSPGGGTQDGPSTAQIQSGTDDFVSKLYGSVKAPSSATPSFFPTSSPRAFVGPPSPSFGPYADPDRYGAALSAFPPSPFSGRQMPLINTIYASGYGVNRR